MTFAADLRDRIMATSLGYRLWQAPFAEQKLAPLLACLDVQNGARVLDLACGPGTNTRHFLAHSYTGVDINGAYVERARGRYRARFIVADATDPRILPGERFDLILVNSFLHHLPTGDVCKALDRVCDLLDERGNVHVLDLILPQRRSIARLLARAD